MGGMKRNSSQKNTKTVYSEYSYSGIVPKEHALRKEAKERYLQLLNVFLESYLCCMAGFYQGLELVEKAISPI